MPLDILQHPSTFPKVVYILAPGILGCDYWPRIPENAFVITVNKGILIPNIHKNIWMAEDMGLHRLYPWFDKMAKELIAANHPLMSPNPTPVFGDKHFLAMYPSVPYFYQVGPSLRRIKHRFNLDSTVLYGHATIAYKAVQLAAIKGAKLIILCGVDMMGEAVF